VSSARDRVLSPALPFNGASLKIRCFSALCSSIRRLLSSTRPHCRHLLLTVVHAAVAAYSHGRGAATISWWSTTPESSPLSPPTTREPPAMAAIQALPLKSRHHWPIVIFVEASGSTVLPSDAASLQIRHFPAPCSSIRLGIETSSTFSPVPPYARATPRPDVKFYLQSTYGCSVLLSLPRRRLTAASSHSHAMPTAAHLPPLDPAATCIPRVVAGSTSPWPSTTASLRRALHLARSPVWAYGPALSFHPISARPPAPLPRSIRANPRATPRVPGLPHCSVCRATPTPSSSY
jgi:hypothetical protein